MDNSIDLTTYAKSPYEALYFAMMRSAALEYYKAYKKGNEAAMAQAEEDMRAYAEDQTVDTICKMIKAGISPAPEARNSHGI